MFNCTLLVQQDLVPVALNAKGIKHIISHASSQNGDMFEPWIRDSEVLVGWSVNHSISDNNRKVYKAKSKLMLTELSKSQFINLVQKTAKAFSV